MTVIDTTTNSVIATVPAGAGATSVLTTFNGNGTFAFVTLKNENAVSMINTYTNTGYKWIPVGAQPWGIAQARASAEWQPRSWSQAVYVTNSGSNSVSVIETLNYTVVASIPVGSNPMGIGVGPDGTRAYVANHSSNTVSVIDGRNVVATVPVSVNPVGVVVNSAGTRVYVSHLNGTVSVLDTSPPSRRLLPLCRLEHSPTAWR